MTFFLFLYSFAVCNAQINELSNGQSKSPVEVFDGELLVVVANQDHLLSPGSSVQLASKMNAKILALDSECGHYAFSCEIEKISETVRRFLD